MDMRQIRRILGNKPTDIRSLVIALEEIYGLAKYEQDESRPAYDYALCWLRFEKLPDSCLQALIDNFYVVCRGLNAMQYKPCDNKTDNMYYKEVGAFLKGFDKSHHGTR